MLTPGVYRHLPLCTNEIYVNRYVAWKDCSTPEGMLYDILDSALQDGFTGTVVYNIDSGCANNEFWLIADSLAVASDQ